MKKYFQGFFNNFQAKLVGGTVATFILMLFGYVVYQVIMSVNLAIASVVVGFLVLAYILGHTVDFWIKK